MEKYLSLENNKRKLNAYNYNCSISNYHANK